jgi:hypothetical protein
MHTLRILSGCRLQVRTRRIQPFAHGPGPMGSAGNRASQIELRFGTVYPALQTRDFL